MSPLMVPSTTSLPSRTSFSSNNPTQSIISSKHITPLHLPQKLNNPIPRISYIPTDSWKNKAVSSLVSVGIALSLASVTPGGDASAAEFHLLGMQFSEPDNALSLPTWAIHVSSVVEWIIAMVLVWQYGERPGYESWKGLSWGMVPLLGGAFCACTWHFFYNAESLSIHGGGTTRIKGFTSINLITLFNAAPGVVFDFSLPCSPNSIVYRLQNWKNGATLVFILPSTSRLDFSSIIMLNSLCLWRSMLSDARC